MDNLHFIPTLHKDEDLRSITFRHHALSANRTIEETILELYKVRTDNIPFISSASIEYYFNKFPSVQSDSLEKFIFNHSYLSLLAIFTKLSVLDFSKSITMHKMRRLFSNLISKEIKYCLNCVIEDYDYFGECYVHRIHQFKNLEICIIHQTRLVEQCPFCKIILTSSYPFFFLSKKECPFCSVPFVKMNSINYDPDLEIKLGILNDIDYILNGKIEISSKLLALSYSHNLKDKNVRTIISEKECEIQTLEKIGLPKLNFYGITNVRLTNIESVPKNILFHIQLIRIISGSASQFFERDGSNIANYFDEHRDRKCLNFLCFYFMQPVVKKSYIKYNEDKQQYVVCYKCHFCNFCYSKVTSTDSTEFDTYDIVETGGKWTQGIISLANQIGMRDSVSNNNEKRTRIKDSDLLLEQLKRKIMELKANGILSRKQLKRKIGKIKMRLITKEASEWFDVNFPPRNQGAGHLSEEEIQLLWKDKDMRIATEVVKAAQQIYLNPPKNRVAKETILKKIPINDKFSLIFNNDKLPKALDTLNKYIEEKECYQIRKIPSTVRLLKNAGEKVNVENFMKRSIYKECSDTVVEKIRTYIKQES